MQNVKTRFCQVVNSTCWVDSMACRKQSESFGGHHDVPELSANHKEADSSMFLHIAHAKQTLAIDRVVLWSLDADVACMCPRYCSMTGIKELYLKTGTGHKKSFVPMHTITAELGEDMAFTHSAAVTRHQHLVEWEKKSG